ncbi:MAG: endonuclease/exonuclease/phosphatase family protein [Actinomycetota bacterium]|nr:endonuclease/exonuclease/phosphatase family protein [Actinomycetota bacterium]
MRIVSFNLLHGRSLTDGLVDPARLTEAVTSLRPDVLGMQEVDRGQSRSGGTDLTAVAAAAMDAAEWRFVPALVGTPGGDWRAAGDEDTAERGEAGYGVGLASRLPVREWHVVRLPAARVRSPIMIPGTRRVVWLQDEPRVGLAAVVLTPSGPMTVATTHLSFVPGWNGVQLRRLVKALRGLPAPQVLVGDLNMPGGLPRLLSGWRSLATVKTYPTDKPAIQLDHALGRGALPAVRSAEALAMPLSDHRALVVELADVDAAVTS